MAGDYSYNFQSQRENQRQWWRGDLESSYLGTCDSKGWPGRSISGCKGCEEEKFGEAAAQQTVRGSQGCGAHSWPEGDAVTSGAWCPELGRTSPVLMGSPSLAPSVLCAPSCSCLPRGWGQEGVSSWNRGHQSILIWGGCSCSPPSTPRPFSLPTGKLVSPPPNHRKLSLSHLWRVLELSAVHIFGRERAVRPKPGVR